MNIQNKSIWMVPTSHNLSFVFSFQFEQFYYLPPQCSPSRILKKKTHVIHWDQAKMAAILQTTLWSEFSNFLVKRFPFDLNFPKRNLGPLDNKSAWFQVLAWHQRCDNSLLEPMMAYTAYLIEWVMDSTLTHWGRDKMAAIFQKTFSNAFSSMKMNKFRLRFHWSLFPRV